eukprot:TRINITY_DN3014_c0_g1_i1.p1 TRINITY_DN3014_c0_g1~~TRINITY_DN3014_c0_g1_i1.p1  ORF type:complete len:114 (+),score=20.46 TRINITY_DN3014_c0_g1_i1:656-997(+)
MVTEIHRRGIEVGCTIAIHSLSVSPSFSFSRSLLRSFVSSLEKTLPVLFAFSFQSRFELLFRLSLSVPCLERSLLLLLSLSPDLPILCFLSSLTHPPASPALDGELDAGVGLS